MELRHLRYFTAVAEELNFSRAALRLRVAQPALSKQVKDLEEEIGVRLLERSSHHVALTAAGEVYYRRARQLLTDSQEAVAAAQRAQRGEVGSLSIGFIGSISHELLPKLLQEYRLKYPAVELSLNELGPTQQIEELVNHRLDLGFVGLAFSGLHPDLEIFCLAEQRLMAAVPADHPLAVTKSVTLTALKEERFILTSRRNAPVFNEWLVDLCHKEGFVPQVVREVDRAPTVLNYIVAGLGISIFPAEIAKSGAPGVAFVPLAKSIPWYRYCMAWRKKTPEGPVRRFVGLAKEMTAGRKRED